MNASTRSTSDAVIAGPPWYAVLLRSGGAWSRSTFGRRHDGVFGETRTLVLGVCVVAMLALATGGAHADGLSVKRILDLLYPQSVAWTRLGAFAHAPPHLFDDPIHVETLGNFNRLQTDADRCAPMLRMFLDRARRNRFRAANVFGSGDDDLVYAGPQPCAEGDWTIIWRHGLNATAQVSVVILESEVQRIVAGAAPKAVGVAGGCCGDPWNYYCLYDPVPQETCTAVPGALTIPHPARLARGQATLHHDAKLLPAPNTTLEPDSPYQPPVRQAGAMVEQLMTVTDSAGASWRLVRAAVNQGDVSGRAQFVVGWVAD